MIRPAGTASISAMRFTISCHLSRIGSGIGGSRWSLGESKASFQQGDTSFTEPPFCRDAKKNGAPSAIQRFLGSYFTPQKNLAQSRKAAKVQMKEENLSNNNNAAGLSSFSPSQTFEPPKGMSMGPDIQPELSSELSFLLLLLCA